MDQGFLRFQSPTFKPSVTIFGHTVTLPLIQIRGAFREQEFAELLTHRAQN